MSTERTSTLQLETILKEIGEREKLIDCEIIYKYSNEKGDGYLGIVKAVELKGKQKTIGLILKNAPESDKLRQQTPIRDAFIVEIYFYEKIYPTFVAFQNEYEVLNKFSSVPKCYATIDTPKQELVVLENLKLDGYDMWNRKQTMDDEHIRYVFNEYGKFHGISYAMKELDRERFDKLSSQLPDIMAMFWVQTNIPKVLTGMVEKITPSFDMAKEKSVHDCFVKFFNDINRHFEETSILDDYAIITHGDCWCNNMMFKYNKGKHPEAMRLIDFQLSGLASPVRDLSYFFYVCASKEIMKNYKTYLKIYYDSLTTYLKQYDLDSNKIITFDQLLEQWRKYSKFGLILSVMLIKVMLSDSDEAPDITKSAEMGENPMEAFNFVSKHEKEFQGRVKDVIYHFYENKFIY